MSTAPLLVGEFLWSLDFCKIYSTPYVIVSWTVIKAGSCSGLRNTHASNCISIVSISRRGSKEETIFPRREGTYLTWRCSSSNFLADWYEQYCSPTWVGLISSLPCYCHSWPSHYSLRGSKERLELFLMWYSDRARPRSVPVLLVSVCEEVRRTTSPRQVSTFPPGKYNF